MFPGSCCHISCGTLNTQFYLFVSNINEVFPFSYFYLFLIAVYEIEIADKHIVISAIEFYTTIYRHKRKSNDVSFLRIIETKFLFRLFGGN